MTNPEIWLAARIAAGQPAETWKPVPGWYYEQVGLPVPAMPHQISDQSCLRTAKGRVLTQRPHNRPREVPPERRYRQADLCLGKEKATVLVHQVVLAAFAGAPEPGQESRHLNDIPVHNWWPENLAWGTPDQNAADKARQARYHTPAAKARRSEGARRGRATQLAERDAWIRANTPSPTPKAEGRRGWLQKVMVTLSGRRRRDL